MTTKGDVPALSFSQTYKNLRLLFVLGLAIQIALLFVPAYAVRVGDFFGLGGEERLLSSLDMIRRLFQTGRTGWGFFNLGVYSAFGAIMVLAFTRPHQWVFVLGAAIASFLFLLQFFGGTMKAAPLVVRVLDPVSLGLLLTGFWIRPTVAAQEHRDSIS